MKMRNTVEKQLSWFTLLLAAFYSLLASCRGEECGHEELASCARPLGEITNNNELGFVATKEELTALCPDLEAGMTCIKLYTMRCMAGKQRDNFNNLYKGVNMAIIELCQEGPYQDYTSSIRVSGNGLTLNSIRRYLKLAQPQQHNRMPSMASETFLKHAPCMQKVQSDYEICSKKYQHTVLALEKKNQTRSSEPVKSICCAFQEYLDCSHHTVRRKCGDETAVFTKNFLDRMASSLIKMHCARYTHEECALGSGASYFSINASLLVVVGLISRYFT